MRLRMYDSCCTLQQWEISAAVLNDENSQDCAAGAGGVQVDEKIVGYG